MRTKQRVHELKTWPEPFWAMADGNKTFEFRRDDRGFMVGDILVLRLWEPKGGGHQLGMFGDYHLLFRVTYVLSGKFDCPATHAVLGGSIFQDEKLDIAQAEDHGSTNWLAEADDET